MPRHGWLRRATYRARLSCFPAFPKHIWTGRLQIRGSLLGVCCSAIAARIAAKAPASCALPKAVQSRLRIGEASVGVGCWSLVALVAVALGLATESHSCTAAPLLSKQDPFARAPYPMRRSPPHKCHRGTRCSPLPIRGQAPLLPRRRFAGLPPKAQRESRRLVSGTAGRWTPVPAIGPAGWDHQCIVYGGMASRGVHFFGCALDRAQYKAHTAQQHRPCLDDVTGRRHDREELAHAHELILVFEPHFLPKGRHSQTRARSAGHRSHRRLEPRRLLPTQGQAVARHLPPLAHERTEWMSDRRLDGNIAR